MRMKNGKQIERLKEIALDLGLDLFVEDLSGITGCKIEGIERSDRIMTIKLRDVDRYTLYIIGDIEMMLVNTSKWEPKSEKSRAAVKVTGDIGELVQTTSV